MLLAFPKCNPLVDFLSTFWYESTNKGVVDIFAMFVAKWTHNVIPPCPKGVWFKLSFYKVLPVFFHRRYHHYMGFWWFPFLFWYFFTLFVVCPHIGSAYLFAKITSLYFPTIVSNIEHFALVFFAYEIIDWNYNLSLLYLLVSWKK